MFSLYDLVFALSIFVYLHVNTFERLKFLFSGGERINLDACDFSSESWLCCLVSLLEDQAAQCTVPILQLRTT